MKGANNEQIALVLNEDYLCSIPLPAGLFFSAAPSGYRHWFRVFTAWVLGWRSRKNEGDPPGLLPELNHHLRHIVWPDVIVPHKRKNEVVALADDAIEEGTARKHVLTGMLLTRPACAPLVTHPSKQSWLWHSHSHAVYIIPALQYTQSCCCDILWISYTVMCAGDYIAFASPTTERR